MTGPFRPPELPPPWGPPPGLTRHTDSLARGVFSAAAVGNTKPPGGAIKPLAVSNHHLCSLDCLTCRSIASNPCRLSRHHCSWSSVRSNPGQASSVLWIVLQFGHKPFIFIPLKAGAAAALSGNHAGNHSINRPLAGASMPCGAYVPFALSSAASQSAFHSASHAICRRFTPCSGITSAAA